MEKELKSVEYVKREDYFDDECCHCVYKKKIDDGTLYCTKLNIYVGDNDWCKYFYDYLKTDKGCLQLNQLARAFHRKD